MWPSAEPLSSGLLSARHETVVWLERGFAIAISVGIAGYHAQMSSGWEIEVQTEVGGRFGVFVSKLPDKENRFLENKGLSRKVTKQVTSW